MMSHSQVENHDDHGYERVALIWMPSDGEEEKLQNKGELKFRVDRAVQSEPLEGGTSKDVVDFFVRQTTRDCFLSCGGEKKIETYRLTPELSDIWKESCQHFHSSTDAIFHGSVLSSQVQMSFPGVRLINTLLCGIQMDQANDPTATPVYEMHNLAEKHETEGILAWLFDRATGYYKIPKGHFFRSGAFAMSRLEILEEHDGTLPPLFSFRCTTHVDVTLTFPALLLRLSPFSKSKAEELGRNACRRAVTRDMTRALAKTRDAYHSYLLHSSKASVQKHWRSNSKPPVSAQSLYRSSF